MELLGAHKFYHRGEADDATSLELVVEPWLEGIQPAMREQWDQIRKRAEITSLLKPSEVLEELIEENAEEKSTNITFWGLLKDVKVLNPGSPFSEVCHIEMEFPRGIDKDKIAAGQSVAIFPKNQDADVSKIIKRFGWKELDLIGNKTVREMLISDVDIRSQKVTFELPPGLKGGFVTLLDLVDVPDFKLEQYLLEDLPRMKPRFYSIVNDPFPVAGIEKTKKLEFLLSRTKFQKNDQECDGLCSQFLTSLATKEEIKCQFSSAYRVL
jgi:sulfite reductase alpha subunit-like flavoprotein